MHDSSDPDIQRHRSLLEGIDACYAVTEVNGWLVQSVRNPRQSAGPALLIADDSDDAAFDLAADAVARYGASLVTLHTRETDAGDDGRRPASILNTAAGTRCPGGIADPALTMAMRRMVNQTPYYRRSGVVIIVSRGDGPEVGYARLNTGRTADRDQTQLISALQAQGLAMEAMDVDLSTCSATADALGGRWARLVLRLNTDAADRSTVAKLMRALEVAPVSN